MLDPDFKAKWLAALRSGEYKQAKQTLYDGKGYCCLGVACKVAGAEFVDGADLDGAISLKGRVAVLDGKPISTTTYLNSDFTINIGLTYGEQRELAAMNDRNSSFNDIADFIEKQY